MRTRSLAALFFLGMLLPGPAGAQFIRTAGVKGGLVSATQEWTYSQFPGGIGEESLWGLDLGGYVEWFSHPVFSLSTEFHYIEKGFQTRVEVTTATAPTGTGQYITQKGRATYFSFPLLLKARADIDGVTLYGAIGPRIDLLLGTSGSGFTPVLEKFRKTEWGASLAVGAETPLHPAVTLGAEIRFSPAFQDAYVTDLLKVRNRSFEFLVVIGF